MNNIIDYLVTNLQNNQLKNIVISPNEISKLKQKLFNYLNIQLKSPQNYVNSAYENITIIDKDNIKHTLKINIQLEILNILTPNFHDIVAKFESNLANMQLYLEDSQTRKKVKSDPIDFSSFNNCAHLFGLPKRPDFSRMLKSYYRYNSLAFKTNITPTEDKNITSKFEILYNNVKTFLEVISPSCLTIKEYQINANKITEEILSFINMYHDNLSKEQYETLSNLIILLTTNMKNMDNLIYSDLVKQKEFVESPSFKIFCCYILNNDMLKTKKKIYTKEELIKIIQHQDYQSLINILKTAIDDQGNYLLPIFNGHISKIIQNIIIDTNVLNDLEKATEVNYESATNWLKDIKDMIDEDSEETLIILTEDYQSKIKYVSLSNKINPNQIKALKKELKKTMDFLQEKYHNMNNYQYLIAMLNDFNQQLTTSSSSNIDTKEYYMVNDFKRELLLLINKYEPQLLEKKNPDIWQFYQQYKSFFSVSLEPSDKNVISTYNPFKNMDSIENYINLIIDDIINPEYLEMATKATNSNDFYNYANSFLENYYQRLMTSSNEILIKPEEYIIYNKIIKQLKNKEQVFSDTFQNSTFHKNIKNIESFFTSHLSINYQINLLTSERIKLDQELQFKLIEEKINNNKLPNKDLGITISPNFDTMDYILIFDKLLTDRNFINYLNSAPIIPNFAKIINKLDLIQHLSDIAYTNIQFKIIEKNEARIILQVRNNTSLELQNHIKRYVVSTIRNINIDSEARKNTARMNRRDVKIAYFENKRAQKMANILNINSSYEEDIKKVV